MKLENAQIEWETKRDGITLIALRYFSHDIGDFPLQMAGILAVPSSKGPHPALLHLHGGAQCAQEEVAFAWAERGYVTLCPDWSVLAGVNDAPHATVWPDGMPFIYQTACDASEASIGHIVRSVRQGLSLLASWPSVQSDRIGMVGISWGGLMTWLVNGTDTRLRTAIAAYGCGLAPERDASASWRAAFQPLTVAHTQHAPILHLNGTHDFFGHLDTAEDLLRRVGTKARRLYVPNEDHGLNETARACAYAWLARHLRGDGSIPPEPDDAPAPHKQFYYAPNPDRSAVWRTVSGATSPATGRWFATETHTDGLAISSPIHDIAHDPTPARVDLWSADVDGLDGLFLRWELDNLRVHAPATAQLIRGEKGIHLDPPRNRFTFFIRTDAIPPADTAGLKIALDAPCDTTVQLALFTAPEIADAHRWDAPSVTCRQTGRQELTAQFGDFAHTEGTHTHLPSEHLRVVRLEVQYPGALPAKVLLYEARFALISAGDALDRDASAKPDPLELFESLHQSGEVFDAKTARKWARQVRKDRANWDVDSCSLLRPIIPPAKYLTV